MLLQKMGLDDEAANHASEVWHRLYLYFDTADYLGNLRALRIELGLSGLWDDALLVRIAQDYEPEIVRQITASEGAIDILTMCRRRGLCLGIVSNGDPEYQWKKVTMAGLAGYFDPHESVIKKNVREGKPHPEPLLECCRRLNTDPATTAYVGDRIADVITARLAGCISVRLFSSAPEVIDPPKQGGLSIEVPSYVIQSLRELPKVVFGDPM